MPSLMGPRLKLLSNMTLLSTSMTSLSSTAIKSSYSKTTTSSYVKHGNKPGVLKTAVMGWMASATPGAVAEPQAPSAPGNTVVQAYSSNSYAVPETGYKHTWQNYLPPTEFENSNTGLNTNRLGFNNFDNFNDHLDMNMIANSDKWIKNEIVETPKLNAPKSVDDKKKFEVSIEDIIDVDPTDGENQIKAELQKEISYISSLNDLFGALENSLMSLQQYKVEIATVFTTLPAADKEEIAKALSITDTQKYPNIKLALDDLIKDQKDLPGVSKLLPGMKKLFETLQTMDDSIGQIQDSIGRLNSETTTVKKIINQVVNDPKEKNIKGSFADLFNDFESTLNTIESKDIDQTKKELSLVGEETMAFIVKTFKDKKFDEQGWKKLEKELKNGTAIVLQDKADIGTLYGKGAALFQRINDLLPTPSVPVGFMGVKPKVVV